MKTARSLSLPSNANRDSGAFGTKGDMALFGRLLLCVSGTRWRVDGRTSAG